MGKMIALLLASAFSVNVWAQSLPNCPRPPDMSVTKAVTEYVACLEKKKKFCGQRNKEKDSACMKFRAASAPPFRFPENPEDINPTERCTIYRDGSYRCVQNPVRFITKDVPKIQPASTAAPSGSAAPAADGAPTEEGTPVAPGSTSPSNPK